MLHINNLPEYARDRAYIVYTPVDGQAWFFSAWDDQERAVQQALEYGCQVVPNERVIF